MELNAKKCSEVIMDFRKNKIVIPPVCIDQRPMSRVKTFKLLGLWLNDNLNWETNAEHMTNKATKLLYFLKVLKSYGAPKNNLKIFHCCVIRSTLDTSTSGVNLSLNGWGTIFIYSCSHTVKTIDFKRY